MATPKPMNPNPVSSDPVSAGRVVAVSDEVIAVERAGGRALARRAASCLLAPRPDDRVLCAEVEDVVYVLAVLERTDGTTAIEVDGDLSLRSRRGSVHVAAGEGDLLMEAGRLAQLRSETLRFLANETSWVSRELRVLGEHLSFDATRIRQASDFAERVAHSVKESFGSSYRSVSEREHVRAGSMTWSLSNMLRLHAETAVVSAKKLIKLDGDQIHLG